MMLAEQVPYSCHKPTVPWASSANNQVHNLNQLHAPLSGYQLSRGSEILP